MDALPKLVRAWAKEFGSFDGLVHSAGLYTNRPLRAVRSKELINLMSVNAFAGVMLAKGLSLAGSTSEQGGSAVFLSSVLGQVGQAGVVGYCMSKGAVEQAVKSLAIELRKDKIRVNAIVPASIATPMTEAGFGKLSDDMKDNLMRMHPSGWGEPDDVAAAAIYLLSSASSFVTGASLRAIIGAIK